MDISYPLENIRELTRYPEVLDLLTATAASPNKAITLDLGTLALKSPYALSEAVLYARTEGITLTLAPTNSSAALP